MKQCEGDAGVLHLSAAVDRCVHTAVCRCVQVCSGEVRHAARVSYIHVLLGEALRVFSHHVGQVPLPDVELVHLLLDELHGELLRTCGRQVLPAEGGARADLPAHLRTTRER